MLINKGTKNRLSMIHPMVPSILGYFQSLYKCGYITVRLLGSVVNNASVQPMFYSNLENSSGNRDAVSYFDLRLTQRHDILLLVLLIYGWSMSLVQRAPTVLAQNPTEY